MDTLEEVRQIWKHFDLNNSERSGMKIIEKNEVVKQYGTNTNTDHLKEMGNSIVFYKRGKK